MLDIPLTDIAQRLLLLKQLLPDCDVARMVELQPLMLLKCDEQYLLEVVKPRVDVLTAELPGANISGMVEEDPRLLFEELESSELGWEQEWKQDCSRDKLSKGLTIASKFLRTMRTGNHQHSPGGTSTPEPST